MVVKYNEELEVSQKDILKSGREGIWDDTYLKYNAKVKDRSDFGEYQVGYDKVALGMLEEQFQKAYLKFPNKASRFKYFVDKGYYKEDLLRGGIQLKDIESLYAEYEKYDIGEPTFYGYYSFVTAQTMRVTDEEIEKDIINQLGEEKGISSYNGKELTDLTPQELEEAIGVKTVSIETTSEDILKKLPYSVPKVRFDDKYILMETRADRVISYSLDAKASQGLNAVKRNIKYLAQRAFSPSSPTVTNGGQADAGQLTSCFILKFEDTMDSIGEIYQQTLHLSKIGGGLGFDLTDLRSLGENVKKIDNRAHGILPVAKMLENALRYADQDGKRRGSGAVYLDIFHDDLYRLLDSKKENTDETMRLSDLSMGIVMRDKFMKLFEDKAVDGYYTFAPNSIYKEYGIKLSDIDMDEMYEELVRNPKVKKSYHKFDAVVDILGSVASESGYPYFAFRETMNEVHAFKNAKIYCSNLCTEILQRQDLQTITLENGTTIQRRNAVQCTLASLNVKKVMEFESEKEVEGLVYTMTEHLNGVIDRTDFGKVTNVTASKDRFRAIALGYANVHGMLANAGIPYESDEAIDFINVFGAMINYYSIKASMEQTSIWGVFDEFEETTYADGTYFNKYVTNTYEPQSEKVKGIFSKIKVPTIQDWEWLKGEVMEKGLANAYRLAVAPTGSISYAMGTTAGIAPITQLVENRKTGSSSSAFYPMPNLNPRNYFLYKDAYRVDDFRYLDLVATLQQHIDQGISTTLFITDAYTTAEWWERIVYAWKIGIKTLYYARPKISAFSECESCQ